MPEMKNNFQRGRMNKDLNERLVPNSEYRDALNVEIVTSDGSDMGTLQTIKGNKLLSNIDPMSAQDFKCIGSIADDKNDKLYYMLAGLKYDVIMEYDYKNKKLLPVCVDNHFKYSQRTLNFNKNFLITGINIIDDLLFWTDNNSEPKRISITRGKAGTASFITHTILMVRDLSPSAQPNSLISALDDGGVDLPIEEKHLTVIRKGPPAAPVLEMVDTAQTSDVDGDGDVGGDELIRNIITLTGSFLDLDGLPSVGFIDFVVGDDLDNETISSYKNTDFWVDAILNIYKTIDRSIGARVKVVQRSGNWYKVEILSANPDIEGVDIEGLTVELEKQASIFQFKFPRFAYRYKYEDGEYSAFSPFTQPAFLPGKFNYLPKEGYNLGMVNRLRKLVIKDFVHERMMGEDVVAVDILYKDSNSPNIYSVKTIKRRYYDPTKWDEWNGVTATTVSGGTKDPSNQVHIGWVNRTTGYFPVTTEMIRAVLPANQLLRPWDNVPRKALAQELIGNRIVYGNYLQNYNLESLNTSENNLRVDLDANYYWHNIGEITPEEIQAGSMLPTKYSPAKSLKTQRTYQLGIIYIDKYGRETPVFSDGMGASNATVSIPKKHADKANKIKVQMKNNPPDWATHFKFFIKETSNEYYNLAMDRWYNAEDGNIWLSFPSAERNKVDSETFLTLKKEHDNDTAVLDLNRYKIIAIENEAPRFIKIVNVSMGGLTDDVNAVDTNGASVIPFGADTNGFPLVNKYKIHVTKQHFEDAGWKDSLINQDISQCFFRVKSAGGVSQYYRLKQISYDSVLQAYVLLSSKQFGQDMSHTSADDSYLHRLRTCELEIIKKIPEESAEFEGRFFVKVLKDAALIKNLHLILPPGDGLISVFSKKAQYIAPQEAIANPNFDWNGFNSLGSSGQALVDEYGCSIDENNPLSYAIPNNMKPTDGLHGNNFWKNAANSDSFTPATAILPSGWFIDKVEAFRPFKKKTVELKKDISNINRTAHNFSTGPSKHYRLSSSGASNWSNHNHARMLQVYPINTYNYNGSQNYLGYNAKVDYSAVTSASDADGGNVAPSLGINQTINVMHLSYAGLNGDGTGSYSSWNNADWSFIPGGKHGSAGDNDGDIEFITRIQKPGTLWRWKEDPGQVVYQTLDPAQVDTSLLADYDAANRDRDIQDQDGKDGVYLFNYATISDYIIKVHHNYTRLLFWEHSFADGNCWPVHTCVNTNKEDWASRSMGGWLKEHTCKLPGCCLPMSIGYQPGCYLTMLQISLSKAEHPSWMGSFLEDVPVISGPLGSITLGWHQAHKYFPFGIHYPKTAHQRRRRFAIYAKTIVIDGNTNKPFGLGQVPPHFYLPTNDPTFDARFDVNLNPITQYPTGHPSVGQDIVNKAPGIRPDGMYTGADEPTGALNYEDSSGTVQTLTQIPSHKTYDNTGAIESNMPGTCTFEIVEQFTADPDRFSSTNPAIWETEPKEDVGLDIYHEIGQIYPIHLNSDTIEQHVGAIHKDIKKNSFVMCNYSAKILSSNNTATSQPHNIDVRVIAANKEYVQLGTVDDNGAIMGLTNNNSMHTAPAQGDTLSFVRADGSITEAIVGALFPAGAPFMPTWHKLKGNTMPPAEVGVHERTIVLPWFNCYSFGNGVESDRIRDDYNQITIDNGPKASTTIEEPYLEERRKNGFIWSGLYNSTSGVNDLNQFIQAEAITKDMNPTYGSIQKLHARDTDLVAFCEDRVLTVQANKDSLYNADGNTNVVATNRVLGAIKPFVGDYGISLNPESFASDSYRSYFSDTSRGAILRLSQNGITPISNLNMRDWFTDNLSIRVDQKIIGSFDDNKDEYNITLQEVYSSYDVGILGVSKSGNPPFTPEPILITTNSVANSLNVGEDVVGIGIPSNTVVVSKTDLNNGEWEISISQQPSLTDVIPLGTPTGWGQQGGGTVIWKTIIRSSEVMSPETTLSYSEGAKGWISFKSFIQENGISLNNSYYTFKGGEIYQHHVDEKRNNFYGVQFDSSVDVLFNQAPSLIKSFSTLNYEGSQARITPEINNNPNYYDNLPKDGWYVSEMISNTQELGVMEFWDKESKWFSQIKGVATEWLNDGTAGNIDPKEFSYQGIGNAYEVLCPECSDVTSYDCIDTAGVCECTEILGPGGQFVDKNACETTQGTCCGPAESWVCGGGGGGAKVCYDPGNGLGGYATHCDCVNGSMCCDEGVNYFYNCPGNAPPITVLFGCMDDGISSDPWITRDRPSLWVGGATNYYAGANVASCDCIYINPAQSWDCDLTGNCYDPGTGLGAYGSLASCQAGCAQPCVSTTQTGDPCDAYPSNPIPGNGDPWSPTGGLAGSYGPASVVEYNGKLYTRMQGAYPGSTPGTWLPGEWIECCCNATSTCTPPCPNPVFPNWSTVYGDATNALCDNGSHSYVPGATGAYPFDIEYYAATTPGQSTGGTLFSTQLNITAGTASTPLTLPQGEWYFIVIDANRCEDDPQAFSITCSYVSNPSWDCYRPGQALQPDCYDPGTGNGQYASKSACYDDIDNCCGACYAPASQQSSAINNHAMFPATTGSGCNDGNYQIQDSNATGSHTVAIYSATQQGQVKNGTLYYSDPTVYYGTWGSPAWSNLIPGGLPTGYYYAVITDGNGDELCYTHGACPNSNTNQWYKGGQDFSIGCI